VLVTSPVPLSAVYAIVFPTDEAAREEYGRLDRFNTLPPKDIQWVVSPGMFDKGMTVAAMLNSRYFPETTWSPSATP
jgi:hypothetical protein